jgi:hypothetical protein
MHGLPIRKIDMANMCCFATVHLPIVPCFNSVIKPERELGSPPTWDVRQLTHWPIEKGNGIDDLPSKETRKRSFQKTVSEHCRPDRFDCDSFVSIHVAPADSIGKVLFKTQAFQNLL